MKTPTIPVRLSLDRWSCSIEPFVIRVDPGSSEELEWMSRDGPIEIKFRDGNSPFEGSTVDSAEKAGTPISSGPLRKSVKPGEQYAYDATIRSPRGLIATVTGVVVMVSGLMAVHHAVKILRNPDGTLRVDPDPVKANRPKDERIEWTCDFGRFEINFDKGQGSPFEDFIFAASRNGRARSGRWLKGVLRSQYNYSVRVWLDDGTLLVLDPGVVVDDSGGDDGIL